MKNKNRNCPVCSHNESTEIYRFEPANLVRCSNCKMVFADITLEKTLEKNILTDEAFFQYINSESFFTAAYYDDLIKRINKQLNKTNPKVLEFGCGSGQFMLRAQKQGWDISGADFSPYAQKAKNYFELNIEIGDIFHTTFDENTFDVIITHATHEHLYHLIEITKKLNKLLKPLGLLVISGVPNFNIISRKLFNNFVLNKPPGHINYFDKKSMRNFIQKSGFDVLTIKTYGFDVWYLKSLLPQKNKNTKKRTAQNTVDKKMIIEKIKMADAKIKPIYAFSAKLYQLYGLFLPGKSFEVFAQKPS